MFSGDYGKRSFRCAYCDMNWPHYANYEKACPICRNEPYLAEGEVPIQSTLAVQLIQQHATREKKRVDAEAAFEKFYEEYALKQLDAEIEQWGVVGAAKRFWQ